MDPFTSRRLAQIIYDERIQHTFKPRPEQPPVTASSAPVIARLARDDLGVSQQLAGCGVGQPGGAVLRLAQDRRVAAVVERVFHGRGGFAQPAKALDFGNSGTGCRLVMGAVAGCPISATFDGYASLRKRPMRRVLDPLLQMGARVEADAEGGRLPVTLRGAQDAIPIVYRTPVPSAQVKSAVLP